MLGADRRDRAVCPACVRPWPSQPMPAWTCSRSTPRLPQPRGESLLPVRLFDRKPQTGRFLQQRHRLFRGCDEGHGPGERRRSFGHRHPRAVQRAGKRDHVLAQAGGVVAVCRQRKAQNRLPARIGQGRRNGPPVTHAGCQPPEQPYPSVSTAGDRWPAPGPPPGPYCNSDRCRDARRR